MFAFSEQLVAAGPKPAPEDWFVAHANLPSWSKRLLWPSGEDALTPAGGYIDFVPAGRQDQHYSRRVNSFDWAEFYDRHNGGAFVDAARRSTSGYDWVLIDSRTGVSDTSGICTVQMPDTLVVCFTLNYQSIEGAAAVAASAVAARRALGRPLRVLPLATRLDGNEAKLLESMLTYARRLFSPLMPDGVDQDRYWREMGVPYFSRYAYHESLVPFEAQVNVSTSGLRAMERLTAQITGGVVDRLGMVPDAHRAEAQEYFERGLLEDALRTPEPAPKRRPWSAWIGRVQYGLRSYPGLTLTSGILIGLVLLALGWTFKEPTVVRTSVAGAVVDAQTGRPVEGASLRFSIDARVIVSQTASDGAFDVAFATASPPADIMVSINAPGYLERTIRMEGERTAGPLTVRLLPDGRLTDAAFQVAASCVGDRTIERQNVAVEQTSEQITFDCGSWRETQVSIPIPQGARVQDPRVAWSDVVNAATYSASVTIAGDQLIGRGSIKGLDSHNPFGISFCRGGGLGRLRLWARIETEKVAPLELPGPVRLSEREVTLTFPGPGSDGLTKCSISIEGETTRARDVIEVVIPKNAAVDAPQNSTRGRFTAVVRAGQILVRHAGT
jgi:hypothetical protein